VTGEAVRHEARWKGLALALTLLTGFTGLVYEVTWQKCLATLLGSHSEATASVLAIFLGGLSLGYALFGRVTVARSGRADASAERRQLLGLYGIVEATIGLHALVFPWLFRGAQAVSIWFPQTHPALAFAFDVSLAALLIGPVTVLMGGTIPILTQALSRSLRDATRVHAHVYAFNTAGAFAGALAAGFVLIPWLGIEGVIRTMGLFNLFAGVAFVVLGSRSRAVSPAPHSQAAQGPAVVPGFGVYAAAALLIGFAMMAIQTVLIRVGGLALGASHFTFSMVVAVFVLCIALGSFVVSALDRIGRLALPAVLWTLAACLALLFVVADDAPYYAHWVRARFGSDPSEFHSFHMATFAGLLAVLGLPVGLSGASLPLIFHRLRHEVGDLGAIAGRLYSWNTAGNLLGALLGGYLLLLWLDLDEVYRLALGTLTLAAVLLTFRTTGGRRSVALGLVAACTAGVAVLPGWDPHRLASGLFRVRTAGALSDEGADRFFGAIPRTVQFYTDDPVASIAVKSSVEKGRRHLAIVSNGKSDGSTGWDYRTMSLAGLLPCMMADRCESAFVIGYGTGVTAGELASLQSVEDVVVAEISRGVIEAAPLFDAWNGGASRSPKVEVVRSDAYRALLRRSGQYDVIVSEPSNPWVTGVEMLYSREFLEAARSRLRPGGVYAQWLHTYETDRETVELILRTYLQVFGDASLWFTKGHDVLLLGFEDGREEIALDRMRERFGRADFRARLLRVGFGSLSELFVHEILPLGVLPELELTGSVHTLMHPRLAHAAARAFFRGGRAELPSGALVERRLLEGALLQRHREARPEVLDETSERRALVEEMCSTERGGLCATGLAWWKAAEPGSGQWETFMRRALPSEAEPAARARATLAELRRFYGDGEADAGPLTPEEAKRVAAIYRRHHTAALPYQEGAWDALWERCRSADGACAAARREAGANGAPDPH